MDNADLVKNFPKLDKNIKLHDGLNNKLKELMDTLDSLEFKIHRLMQVDCIVDGIAIALSGHVICHAYACGDDISRRGTWYPNAHNDKCYKSGCKPPFLRA